MAENWQKSAKSYRGVKYGSPSLEWTSGLDHRLNLVKKRVDFKGKKVLDIGCGVGMFLRQFKGLDAEVYGVDVDEEKIKIAHERFKNVQVAPAENLPFRRDTFDIVWLHEVIEHVEDDEKTISEAFRVLKPGGKVVIFAPNKLWPFETHGVFWADKYRFGNIPLVTYFPKAIYEQMTPHVRNYYRKDIFNLIKGVSYRKVHYQGVFPGFDKLASKIPIFGWLIQKFFRILEKTYLNRLGLSHFLVLEKV
ncbi:class I SAM-dependent methyltransferase [Candidatus Dojkabacteria bacterium]|nr:class I SAM-dependent methyltransferase [Candidatus Dojkabacteria bacterium]